jgi:phage gpG-like protein
MASLISVQVVGADKVAGGLVAFQNVASDLRPFWRDVFAPKFFADVQDVFTMQGQRRGAGGRFSGGRWAPLAPWYRAWKARYYPGKGILERTGRMRGSMMAWNAPEVYWDNQPMYVVAGTRVPYAPKHMTGDPSTHLPARPFLDVPDPAVYAPLLRNWILRSVQSKGVKVTKAP